MVKGIHSMPYITSSGVTNMHIKKQLVSKSFVKTSNQVSLILVQLFYSHGNSVADHFICFGHWLFSSEVCRLR